MKTIILNISTYTGDIRLNYIIKYPEDVDYRNIIDDIKKETDVYYKISNYANQEYYNFGGDMLRSGDLNPWRIKKEQLINVVNYFVKKYGGTCEQFDNDETFILKI